MQHRRCGPALISLRASRKLPVAPVTLRLLKLPRAETLNWAALLLACVCVCALVRASSTLPLCLSCVLKSPYNPGPNAASAPLVYSPQTPQINAQAASRTVSPPPWPAWSCDQEPEDGCAAASR